MSLIFVCCLSSGRLCPGWAAPSIKPLMSALSPSMLYHDIDDIIKTVGDEGVNNIPLVEPDENLLALGSLSYNRDSPGEYGSDLPSARPRQNLHFLQIVQSLQLHV